MGTWSKRDRITARLIGGNAGPLAECSTQLGPSQNLDKRDKSDDERDKQHQLRRAVALYLRPDIDAVEFGLQSARWVEAQR
ncbi:MAG TPA: hypothetical protein VMS00_01480 [Acidimicrobiales bacterium]|nr:hypothetical protein [Acidimicrobiales bacterium]